MDSAIYAYCTHLVGTARSTGATAAAAAELDAASEEMSTDPPDEAAVGSQVSTTKWVADSQAVSELEDRAMSDGEWEPDLGTVEGGYAGL